MLAHEALEGIGNTTGGFRHSPASLVGRADRRNCAFGTIAAVAVLAGCGAAGPDESSRVLRGAARSPVSYLFFDRTWWGRDPDIRAQAIHVRGRRAFLVLAARGTVLQHLELVKGRRNAWRVVSTQVGIVTGPLARRPATPRERAAVFAARHRQGYKECRRTRIYLSTLDGRYA